MSNLINFQKAKEALLKSANELTRAKYLTDKVKNDYDKFNAKPPPNNSTTNRTNRVG